MRKLFWTLALAIPSAIVALIMVAYLDTRFSRIVIVIDDFLDSVSIRMPEVMGMMIGFVIMLTIFALVRKEQFYTE